MSPRISDQLLELLHDKGPSGMPFEDVKDLVADLRDCRASHGELAAALAVILEQAEVAGLDGWALGKGRAALARARQETP